MVPWETLRRLLGLPAGMEPPSSADLARLAIEQPRHARLVGMALRGRTPKEAPAAMVMAALERGALPLARACELLGCVGHGAGYETVRGVLFSSDETEACAFAGIAAARILGRRAEADLSLAIRSAPAREGREGAALGLCELASEGGAATVAHAGLEGRVRMRVAARCAVRMPFDPDFWLEQLESRGLRPRAYATELVYELLVASAGSDARERLERLGARGRDAVRRALGDEELYMLPQKREVLERWAR